MSPVCPTAQSPRAKSGRPSGRAPVVRAGRIAGSSSRQVEKRMPEKRPPPARISASSTRAPWRRCAGRMADNAVAGPGLAVVAAGAHRRHAVHELDLAHAFHLGRTVGAEHRAAFDEHGADDVVASPVSASRSGSM